jgi:hypothetical protein
MTARGILAAFTALMVVVFGAGFFIWSGYIAGVGWLMSQSRCDEGCQDPRDPLSAGLDWAYYENSWQWTAIALLGLVVFCAGVVVLVALAKGRTSIAWIAFSVHLLALASLLYIRSSAGPWDGEPSAAPVLASEIGGLLAIRLRASFSAIERRPAV